MATICRWPERQAPAKNAFAAAFMGKLIAKQDQFCLIDPEGDYQDLPGAITIGDSSQIPLIEHVIKVLTYNGPYS